LLQKPVPGSSGGAIAAPFPLFSRVEMSPISSPHSWARKVRRMILQRACFWQAGDELDFLGIIMPRLKEVKIDDAHSGAKNMSAKKDELYCVNLSNMLN
jgi:hypothetical protein